MTTKKETKRLTVTDILKEKEKYSVDKQETKDVTISRLNADVLIRKPEKSLCMETFQMGRDEDTADSADAYMVYNTIVEPNLKDAALQAEFGVREPLEIVDQIFEPGEVAQLAELAMEMAGFKKGIVAVKTAKN